MPKINLQDFISQLEVELDDIEPGSLTAESNFREIESWSSMHALILIAFADAEYNVVLNGDDLRKAQTVGDIYNIISAKIPV